MVRRSVPRSARSCPTYTFPSRVTTITKASFRAALGIRIRLCNLGKFTLVPPCVLPPLIKDQTRTKNTKIASVTEKLLRSGSNKCAGGDLRFRDMTTPSAEVQRHHAPTVRQRLQAGYAPQLAPKYLVARQFV